MVRVFLRALLVEVAEEEVDEAELEELDGPDVELELEEEIDDEALEEELEVLEVVGVLTLVPLVPDDIVV